MPITPKPKFEPPLEKIEEQKVQLMVESVPIESQQHYGKHIATHMKRPENTGICGGYAAYWLQQRLWNKPIREEEINSHKTLGGAVSNLQAKQKPNDVTPMFYAAGLRVVANTFGNVLNPFDVPDGFGVYVSVSYNKGDGHAFAIDTRKPDDCQFADVGAGVYRCDGKMTAREIYDFHTAVIDESLAKNDDRIVSVDCYALYPSPMLVLEKELLSQATSDQRSSVPDIVATVNEYVS